MRRVVVTGVGAISPIGNNATDMWESMKKGVCGIDRITYYDTENKKVKLAGEVKNFDPIEVFGKFKARKLDPFVMFALVAAKEAMEQANIDLQKEDLLRCGVIIAGGIGGLGTIKREAAKGEEKGYEWISPNFIPMSIINMAAGQVAIEYGFHGMCSSVVTACAGGSNAIGDSFRQIRDGYQDVMICGGSESCINELGMSGFSAMNALSVSEDKNRASIPFDKERTGFVMGEGSGILVLEEYEHALKRNAEILCEITGYGVSCDAYHVTAPLEDGSMAAECMKAAMKDAKIEPFDIDYINAHGTSTVMNDKAETLAIRKAFKEAADKIPVSSTKSMTGHLLAAAGAVEAIACVLSVRNDFIPPTINYRVSDEECNLDVVPNEGRNVCVNYAMTNSLGFGGHNASLIFKKYKQE